MDPHIVKHTSQSQTRSQSLPESQLHRPAFPSQRMQAFKPGKISIPATVKQGWGASEMSPGGHPESHLVVNRVSSAEFPASDTHEDLAITIISCPTPVQMRRKLWKCQLLMFQTQVLVRRRMPISLLKPCIPISSHSQRHALRTLAKFS